VRDVRVGHEDVVVADPREAAADLGARVDRHALPDDVPLADQEARVAALVLHVLRAAADDGVGEDERASADLRVASTTACAITSTPGPSRTRGPTTA